jgi:hypothetical protein
MVWIVILSVVAATLGVHLGLFESVAEVATRISRCEKCTSFWLCICALTYCGYDAITVISLSIIAAYLSYWVGLFLIALQKFYSWLRKRLNKQS